jgi:hypothetical protein
MFVKRPDQFTWTRMMSSRRSRHLIAQGMAGGFFMYLFTDAFLPALDGAPFRFDGLDLLFRLGFGLILGVWNGIEPDPRRSASASDLRHIA